MLDMQNVFKRYLHGSDERRSEYFHSYKTDTWQGRTITLGVTYRFGRLQNRVKEGVRTIRNEDRTKND